VNPCAFTTIIFLLTSLVLAGRRRAEILLAGSAFTFAVFAAYFLVGVGLFHSLRAAASFPLVSSALRWALVAVLLALAALSVRDFALARSGRAGEMALRLPDPIKRRMQRTILDNARSSAIVGGSLVLGAVVSLFELACTGQVYFPAVAWLVRTQGGLGAYLLLAVYNAGFVLPLAVVFVLAWRGVSSRTLTRAAQAHLGTVKLALAVVFVGLAALTLAT
jgi:cytochrome c biogenesis protein CcdA